MSRSVHTRPARILAAERVRLPYAPRGSRDPSLGRRRMRALKDVGVCATAEPVPALDTRAETPQPRIIVQRPRPGWGHPAKRSDVSALLRGLGAIATYGLRSIELVDPDHNDWNGPRFGRLVVPGRILLYAQPVSPWTLPGLLAEPDSARLRAAGATIDAPGDGVHSVVHWPDDTLRDFMLFDVLLHEIGHHILQHFSGKRRVRIARTRDHERFAERFARVYRQAE